MSHKVWLRASRANARRNLFSGCDFEICRQALRAMANVFVFLSFAPSGLTSHAWLHRFGWRGALESLNAGLLIGAHQMNALRVQLLGLFVEVADCFDLHAKFFCVAVRRVEPVFSPVRFDRDLIKENARHSTPRCSRRFCV